MNETEEYVLISKDMLLKLRQEIKEFAKEHDGIKKDLEKLRTLKG